MPAQDEPGLRALTIRAPWAGLIACGAKSVENRSWATPYRGDIALHNGLGVDRDALGLDYVSAAAAAYPARPDVPGHVIAVARLAGCHRDEDCCRPWGWGDGLWHWTWSDIVTLTNPIPSRGAQKLWRPSAEVVALVRAQLPDRAGGS